MSSPSGVLDGASASDAFFGIFEPEADRTLLIERTTGPASQQRQFFSVKNALNRRLGTMIEGHGPPPLPSVYAPAHDTHSICC